MKRRRMSLGPSAILESSYGLSAMNAPPPAPESRRLVELARYHEATKHSLASVRSSPHHLDWRNKPLPFKVYASLEAIAAPDDVGRLCLLGNGVLRWRRSGAGEVYGFR